MTTSIGCASMGKNAKLGEENKESEKNNMN